MSVDEDLVAACVPEAASFLLVSEQRVRKPSERPELCLVALSTDIDDDSLTAGHRAVVSPARRPLGRRHLVDRRHLERRRLGPPCLVLATTSSLLSTSLDLSLTMTLTLIHPRL